MASSQATAQAAPDWTLSIVSHGHATSVALLLDDIARNLDPARYEIIVTQNLPEDDIECGRWRGGFSLIRNRQPVGFAANHNAALARAQGRWFAAIDPDLQLRGDPFSALQTVLAEPALRLAAPRVFDDRGCLQDNARRLITPVALLRRYLRGQSDSYDDIHVARPVEWLAGLFVAGSVETMRRLGGFDVRYFLYCEDTDLSLRCWNLGGDVWVAPSACVVHVARRRTLRSAAHFLWHCRSLLRLWTSRPYWTYALGPRPARLRGASGR